MFVFCPQQYPGDLLSFLTFNECDSQRRAALNVQRPQSGLLSHLTSNQPTLLEQGLIHETVLVVIHLIENLFFIYMTKKCYFFIT